LNTTLTPHSIIPGDACFAYFNKNWGIPRVRATRFTRQRGTLSAAGCAINSEHWKLTPSVNLTSHAASLGCGFVPLSNEATAA